MTTKEYLEQVKNIQKRIDSMEIDLTFYRKEMVSIGATDYSSDKIQSSTLNDVSNIIIKLEEFKQRMIDEKNRLISVANDVIDTINQVRDNKLYLLLKYRYIDDRTWRQIAVLIENDETKESNISKRLHQKALWEVEKIRKSKKSCILSDLSD